MGNNIRCNICGAWVGGEGGYCENCGNKIQESMEIPIQNSTMMQEQTPMQDQIPMQNAYPMQEQLPVQNVIPTQDDATKNPKTAKRAGVWGIISSVIIAVVFSLVGKYAGGCAVEKCSGPDPMEEIDAYLESWDYEPGTVNGNSYTSNYFGFAVDIDEEWEIYSDAERQEQAAGIKEGMINGAKSTVEAQSISKELMDKYLETIYAECEMGVYAIEDDLYAGNMVLYSMGLYADDGNEEMFVKGIMSSLGDSGETSESKKVMGGIEWSVVEGSMTIEGNNNIKLRAYCTRKDSVFCAVIMNVLEGYEHIMDDFEQSFTEVL